MNRRKEELEQKKRKLDELRRAREERKLALTQENLSKDHVSEKRKQQHDMGIDHLKSTGSTGPTSERKAIDDLVARMLGEHSSTPSRASTSDRESETGSGRATPIHSNRESYMSTISNTSGPMSPPSPQSSLQTVKATLTTTQFVQADIPPELPVVYHKEVQTSTEEEDEGQKTEEQLRAELMAEIEKLEAEKRAILEEERRQASEEDGPHIEELTEEQKLSIIESPGFLDFMEAESKIIERALSDRYDYMKDYTVGDMGGDSGSDKRVKLAATFWDERILKNRCVTDVAWSPKFPELSVSSYNKNPLATNDPDGIACVWNLHLADRPEFVFHAQSDVLSVRFSEFHPNLIVGGTYSGQIVIWDTRSKSAPVLKTPLSGGGHTHPVYGLTMVGTQNAHNLISASTDGLVCSWQLDMLAQPQDYVELLHSSHSKTDEVSITCFDFPGNETTAFWVGTEESNVYQANRYDRAGSKTGINQLDVYRGHFGSLTGLHFHPAFGTVDFSDLFITSSVDWTVKLWRAKSASKPSTQLTHITPLYSFDYANDYVYDVKWSPAHPAIFGSVDGSGRFDLWNLNIDVEMPVESTLVGTGRALNKLSWDKEGRHVALGSSDGKTYVYDIGEMASPKTEDWAQLQRSISEKMVAEDETIHK